MVTGELCERPDHMIQVKSNSHSRRFCGADVFAGVMPDGQESTVNV